MYHYSSFFAQAYNEGAYGEGTYSCSAEQQQDGTCTTSGGGTNGGDAGGAGGSGGLADTGVAVLVLVTLACLIMFVAMIVRIWRRPKMVLQPVVSDEAASVPAPAEALQDSTRPSLPYQK